MFYTTTKWVEIFDVTIQNTDGNFKFQTQLNKVKKILSYLYPNLIIRKSYPISISERHKTKRYRQREKIACKRDIGCYSDYAKVKMQERT